MEKYKVIFADGREEFEKKLNEAAAEGRHLHSFQVVLGSGSGLIYAVLERPPREKPVKKSQVQATSR